MPVNAWQATNALGLDPGNQGGRHHATASWVLSNDAEAAWEYHSGYRAAPQNPVAPDYYERMNRAGSTVGWASWRTDGFADNATRRWETSPYGSDRPKGRGRGRRW